MCSDHGKSGEPPDSPQYLAGTLPPELQKPWNSYRAFFSQNHIALGPLYCDRVRRFLCGEPGHTGPFVVAVLRYGHDSPLARMVLRALMRHGALIAEASSVQCVAVFGFPVAHERDVQAAVQALSDIAGFQHLGETVGEASAVYMAMATGPVELGPPSTSHGRLRVLAGETYSKTTRLLYEADKWEAILCPETARVAAQWYATAPLPVEEGAEPGYDEPCCYRLLGTRQNEVASGDQNATPWVGRHKELKTFQTWLKQVGQEARCEAACIRGEVGIGKTRFVREALLREGRAAEVVWWQGSPTRSLVFLSPVLTWLRDLTGLQGHESVEATYSAATKLIDHLIPQSDFDPHLIVRLFAPGNCSESADDLATGNTHSGLFSLLGALIYAATATPQAPGVLVVDDAQWLDAQTRDLLKWLADGSPQRPLAIVTVCRTPGTCPTELSPRDYHLELGPLQEDERRALLEELTPVDEFLPEIRNAVFGELPGNPLFLHEMSRLISEMLSEEQKSAEDIRNNISRIVPLSLEDIIRTRLERLDASTRRVLQTASLLGLDFAAGLLDLLDSIHDNLNAHFQVLRDHEYLGEHTGGHERRLSFNNGCHWEVAYSSLKPDQKKRLHTEVAEALEQHFADRLPQYYELIAFHYSRAGNGERAIYYLVKAGDRQRRFGGAELAVENYSEAIHLLHEGPGGSERAPLMGRILLRCAALLRGLGRLDESREMLEGALECARSIESRNLLLEVRFELAVSDLLAGKSEEALQAMVHLAREAGELHNPRLEAAALNAAGVAHWQEGRHEEALRAFNRLARLADARGLLHAQADAVSNAGLIYWRWGQHAQALRTLRRALALTRQTTDYQGLCATLMNIGIVEEHLGLVGAARQHFRQAARLARQIGYARALAAVESNLSDLARRSGALTPALEHAAASLEVAEALDDPLMTSVAAENLALAHLAAGRREEAERRLLRAAEMAGEDGSERAVEVRLSRLDIRLHKDPPDAECARESEALVNVCRASCYHALLPRAYRLRAEVLELTEPERLKECRDLLDGAVRMAAGQGSYFEELESWKSLAHHYRRRRDSEAEANCIRRIASMTAALQDAV